MAYFGFHAFQSFAEGEVTPEVAHEIGVKLANELWGDRFEVVVSTHINTKHIHNHFCLNSVSFKDGKKYYDTRGSYAIMRNTSDRLCEEYNLNVIQEKECPKSKLKYENFYKNEVQRSDFYNTVKEDIDYAIGQAYSYNDFLGIMKKLKYEVINRSGKLSVRPLDRKRNIRIERAFGEDYSIQNITKKIFETEEIREPFPEARVIKEKRRYTYKSRTNPFIKKKKVTGIRALYLYYCYLFRVYPQKPRTNARRVISKELREEIKKMDKISNEAEFLHKTGIQTEEELLKYKSSSITNKNELKSKRANLWKKYHRAKTENEKQEILQTINELTKEIDKLKYEQEMIEDIESRIPQMKQNIKELEGKEKSKQEKSKERSE